MVSHITRQYIVPPSGDTVNPTNHFTLYLVHTVEYSNNKIVTGTMLFTVTQNGALTLTDGEGSVSMGSLLAHLHWVVVILRSADVPVREAGRHEGADVHAGVMFVEQEPRQLAIGADRGQAAFVLHELRGEEGTIKGLFIIAHHSSSLTDSGEQVDLIGLR